MVRRQGTAGKAQAHMAVRRLSAGSAAVPQQLSVSSATARWTCINTRMRHARGAPRGVLRAG